MTFGQPSRSMPTRTRHDSLRSRLHMHNKSCLILTFSLGLHNKVNVVGTKRARSEKTVELTRWRTSKHITKRSKSKDSSIENIGPYFDVSGLCHGWRNWPAVTINLSPSELGALASCFQTGLVAAVIQRATFVVRDCNNPAHCCRYRLVELEWNQEHSTWKVYVARV